MHFINIETNVVIKYLYAPVSCASQPFKSIHLHFKLNLTIFESVLNLSQEMCCNFPAYIFAGIFFITHSGKEHTNTNHILIYTNITVFKNTKIKPPLNTYLFWWHVNSSIHKNPFVYNYCDYYTNNYSLCYAILYF